MSEQQKEYSLSQLQELEDKLHIQQEVVLQKALQSGDINKIYEARKYLSKIEKRVDNSQYSKAIVVDPLDMTSSLGYKEKFFSMSYDILRAMGRTWTPKSIIERRKDQVKEFCVPQEDKYGTGFVIQKKSYGNRMGKPQKQMTKKERQIADDIVEFMLNCGQPGTKWHLDDFDTFTSKFIEDSLTLDQPGGEVMRNIQGNLLEFKAIDGGTVRIADTIDEDAYQNVEKMKDSVNGYLPSWVQVWNSQIINAFYPWEMMTTFRNPKSDIHRNGYGVSELEDMIQTVTAILNTDFYNANVFKVGSKPGGFLRVHGQVNQAKIDEFKNQWQTQVTGVLNMHKIPVLHAEKAEFIPWSQNNRDMEWQKYEDLLIKICCSSYKIDPSEIGFPMSSGGTDKAPMFEGSQEHRLKYSRDNGLKPLVRWYEKVLNKMIVDELHPGFELKFVGLSPSSAQEEMEYDISSVTNIETLNEVRERRNLPKMPWGDVPLNPVALQLKNATMMGDPNSNQFVDQNQGKDDSSEEDDSNDNPFVKGLQSDIQRLFAVERIQIN